MIAFPNAKINIGLNILRKREDGYHAIESVMVPMKGISYDALELIQSSKFRVKCSGLEIHGDAKNNLCVKAYGLLKKDFSLPPIEIHLHKAIPMGAGLGGGSADGAFMIRMLNDAFKLKLSEKKMINYASKLGSDCPFFIRNEPAFVTGRGDVLAPINLTKALEGKFIVVVYPNMHVNTAEAYNEIDKSKVKSQKSKGELSQLIQLPIEKWKGRIVNNFEEPVFRKHPVLKKIKSQLYSHGAVYASMSGSGSAVYGFFEHKPELKQVFSKYIVTTGEIT